MKHPKCLIHVNVKPQYLANSSCFSMDIIIRVFEFHYKLDVNQFIW